MDLCVCVCVYISPVLSLKSSRSCPSADLAARSITSTALRQLISYAPSSSSSFSSLVVSVVAVALGIWASCVAAAFSYPRLMELIQRFALFLVYFFRRTTSIGYIYPHTEIFNRLSVLRVICFISPSFDVAARPGHGQIP